MRPVARVLCGVAAAALILHARAACAERLPFTTYSSFEGRVYTDINVAVEDRQGFLWVGTEKGLERFDGRSFRHFGKEHGLTRTNVTSLVLASDGALWVGTWGAVFRFDPARGGSFTEVPVEGNKIPLERTLVFLDQKQQVWCVADFLYRLDPDPPAPTFRRAHFGAATSMPWVTAFLADRAGNLWIGYKDLYRVSSEGIVSRVATTDPETLEFTSIVEDRSGRIWLARPNGIWRVEAGSDGDPISFVVSPVLKTDPATTGAFRLIAREHGGVWAGSRQGVLEIDPDGGVLKRIIREHGLVILQSWPLLIDRAGDLWLSSMGGSLQRLAAVGFSSFGAADGLDAPLVRSIWRRRSGDLIVNGSPDVLQRFDGQRFIPIRPALPRGVVPGWGWFQVDTEDRDGQWWIPTGSGLLRFSPVKHLEELARATPAKVYGTSGCFPGGDIFRVYEDSRGDVWVATATRDQETIYRWNRGSRSFSCYRSEPMFGRKMGPTAFLDDGQGTMWIAFYLGQVARYRDGRFECVFDCSGRNGLVESLYLDRRRRLWIGTHRAGVLRVDDITAARPVAVTLTTEDGLSSNRIGGITEDRFGRIYIGTERGVDVLDETGGRIHHFSTAEGLPHPFVGSAYAHPDGEIWLGTLNGVARFTPPARFREEPAIRVLIDGVRVSGIARPLSVAGESQLDGLVLEPDQRDIAIEYVGLPRTLAGTLRYQYRLSEGEPWSPPSADRSLVLAGLDAGSYRIEIRALDAAGRTSAHSALVSFRVLAPFYERSWFVTLALLATLGLAALIYRARVGRLVALERQRTRIAMDLHDEMGSRLGSIALLADVAAEGSVPDVRRGELLGEIAETAADMGGSLTEIVWSLRHDAMSLERVARYLATQGQRLFPGPLPAFVTQFPEKWPDVDMAVATGRAVLLVGQEALRNSARHSRARTVTLELERIGNRWRLTVRDDGTGIRADESRTSHEGFGLESMRRRAEEIQASIEFRSSESEGTTVTLVFDPRARTQTRDRMNIRRTWKRPWDIT
jgi:ligand-binding sensor domain-containing protein/signal transduction histidine kinase